MNEQKKINKEITQNLETNEVDLNFLPGDLNTNISIEQYNLIINEGTFPHKKNTSENKILMISEDNKINKLLKILEPELKKLNIFVKKEFDFEDISKIYEYDKLILNVNILENNIIKIINHTSIHLIQTIILTKRPKFFIDYNALFPTVVVERINDHASVRNMIMLILNKSKSKTKIPQYKVQGNTDFRKDNIFSLHDTNMENKAPFYRFHESYINLKNVDQEYLNKVVQSEVEMLIESSLENCYTAIMFVKLSLFYGLNKCLVFLNATDKKNDSKLLGCILMVLRILSKDENYFSEKIEDSNLKKINSFFTKIAKFDVTKINEIVSGEFLKSESIDFQDNNLFKIIRFSGFLNSKLIKLFPYKVDEFHENCNHSIANNFIEFENAHNEDEDFSSCFLNEFLTHGKFNQYTLHQICKNSSKYIIQNQDKFLKVGNFPIVHFIIGHLIINNIEISQFNQLCEKYSSVIFSEHQKSLVSFYINQRIPNNFPNNQSFLSYLYEYFTLELKINNSNRFSPQFGISNPVLPLYLSFARQYDSDDNYHNLCLLIFSNLINYEWIFNSSNELSKTFSYPNFKNS